MGLADRMLVRYFPLSVRLSRISFPKHINGLTNHIADVFNVTMLFQSILTTFQWGSHPPFFCTSVVVEIIAVFWLFLAVFTLYFATEKSSTFNGEQAKDFMAFGLKEKLN